MYFAYRKASPENREYEHWYSTTSLVRILFLSLLSKYKKYGDSEERNSAHQLYILQNACFHKRKVEKSIRTLQRTEGILRLFPT